MKEQIFFRAMSLDGKSVIRSGAFPGPLSVDTLNKLVSTHFSATVRPGGLPCFADNSGKEIRLYVTVDAALTDCGQEALRRYYAERRAREREESLKEERIKTLMDSMTTDEILRRLSE